LLEIGDIPFTTSQQKPTREEALEYYRNVKLSPELEQAAQKVQEEVTQAYEEAERALEMMRQEGEAEELAAE